MIKVVSVGMQAKLTDTGRRYAQCQGYSQSGAIDWFSYKLANALCKNPLNTPAIEIMAGSFSMQVMTECFIAVTGAECQLAVNRQPVDINQVIALDIGDIVSIGSLKTGLYNYVALHGACLTHEVNLFKSSVCASSRERVGGIQQDGTSLKAGDQVPLQINSHASASGNDTDQADSFSINRPIAKTIQYLIEQTSGNVLPVIFCYQANKFELLQRMKLISSSYQTTNDMNQMGVRLEGPEINYVANTLTSQPIALGAIQIPQNGKPIIMRNDRQTIGGYPIIAVVSRIGLARLSQMTPNTQLSFDSVSQENSLCQYRIINEHLNTIMMRN